MAADQLSEAILVVRGGREQPSVSIMPRLEHREQVRLVVSAEIGRAVVRKGERLRRDVVIVDPHDGYVRPAEFPGCAPATAAPLISRGTQIREHHQRQCCLDASAASRLAFRSTGRGSPAHG
jgi:hypothetical protein